MKVSLNWVKWLNEKYGCAANPAPKGVEALVEKIGAQLGAVDEVIDLGKKYEGIIVAKVVKADKHPNADKLTVCLIDDGHILKKVKRNKGGLVEVVCGAPNVQVGQMVAWIPPGATVPSTYDKDPFVLEAKELRGVVSNGMIASAKELAIGDDHQGIVVLGKSHKPGQLFAEAYHLNDYIIDIENKMFTHRPDLFGMLGVAREIAGIQGQVFKSPDWYKENVTITKPRGDGLKLTVKNQLPKAVPRFTAIVIRDIAVGPSPLWLQTKLSRVGIRPVNNIVDLTNFYMYETAQPLHAYDFDKLLVQQKQETRNKKQEATIIVRKPKNGETLKILGGKTITLQPEDIVIASADKAIGLGGVMGGAETEVDAGTKNIILECANFEMTAVRKSAMSHGLFTDAATRFTKGQSPRQNLAVLAKLVNDILKPELSGGRIASPVIDIYETRNKKQETRVRTSAQFINERLGLDLSVSEIKKLLENVELKVTIRHPGLDPGSSKNKKSNDWIPNQVGNDNNKGTLEIEVPFWRTDIEIPEDIVEEVGRLYGYDYLKLELPTKDLAPAVPNPMLELKTRLRDILSSAGANEVLTYSFINKRLLEAACQEPQNSYHIRNALSPDLQYYRQTLTPSLLERVHPNIKAGYNDFTLFEIGTSHLKGALNDEKLPMELSQLALVFASKTGGPGAPYYNVQKICSYMLTRLSLGEINYKVPEKATMHPALSYYEPSRSASIFVGNTMVGRLGEFNLATRTALKLPQCCAGFEIYLPQLDKAAEPLYQPLNRFPSLEQDLCLRAPVELSYERLTAFVSDHLKREGGKHGYIYRVEPLDIFQKAGEHKHKQMTWHISLEHPERTLTTEEVNRLIAGLAFSAKKILKADRI